MKFKILNTLVSIIINIVGQLKITKIWLLKKSYNDIFFGFFFSVLFCTVFNVYTFESDFKFIGMNFKTNFVLILTMSNDHQPLLFNCNNGIFKVGVILLAQLSKTYPTIHTILRINLLDNCWSRFFFLHIEL